MLQVLNRISLNNKICDISYKIRIDYYDWVQRCITTY